MTPPSQGSSTDYVQTNEQKRLNDARELGIPWKKWGPYLSERHWGTVRKDYSADGNAWDYFSHDQAVPAPIGGERVDWPGSHPEGSLVRSN
jgi:hypothetical protein